MINEANMGRDLKRLKTTAEYYIDLYYCYCYYIGYIINIVQPSYYGNGWDRIFFPF
jgi:hypothetical protein